MEQIKDKRRLKLQTQQRSDEVNMFSLWNEMPHRTQTPCGWLELPEAFTTSGVISYLFIY